MRKRTSNYLFKFFSLILISLIANFTTQNCSAQSNNQSLEQKVKEQGARIAELEKLVEILLSKTSNAESTVRKLEESKKTTTTNSSVAQVSNISKDSGYKKGFYVNEKSGDDSFSLKVNGRMQFRYNGFSRKKSTYTFENGRSGAQSNQNDFEIERGRLSFEGHVFDPKLEYYINFDFDTDDNHDAKAHDFWFNYNFDPSFKLYAGKAFVPGSREWLDGSTSTHLVDRSLATSFFRPDRSLGVWAIGEPLDRFHYRAMIGNGFKTTDLEREDINDDFTYSVSLWGEPIGDYGKGRADLEWHEDLAVRVGGSFTYSPIDTFQLGDPIGEADAVRLSDGTRLTDVGAVAPGATISSYDLYLYALDLAFKYRGWSLNSELYYRSLQDINSLSGASFSSIEDKGFYVDTGYFFYKELLEGVLRFSYIDGELSDGSEYAAGLNWFINGTHLNKITFDVSLLDDSPVSSSGPNYLVGATGILYRLQWQIGF